MHTHTLLTSTGKLIQAVSTVFFIEHGFKKQSEELA